MPIYLKGIGLSTESILNTDELFEIIIDRKQLHKSKKDKNIDCIRAAMLEADIKADVPKIIVSADAQEKIEGIQVASIKEAFELSNQYEEAAIICIQTGKNENSDAAVLHVTRELRNTAYAKVADIIEQNADDESVFQEIYGRDGLVCEAGNIIIGCFALYYNFAYPCVNNGINLFDSSENRQMLTVQINRSLGCRLEKSERQQPIRKLSEYVIVPVFFEDTKEAEIKLNVLKEECSRQSLYCVMENSLKNLQDSDSMKRVVFVASSRIELIQEINLFLDKQTEWFKRDFTWITLNGSYYTASPIGSKSKICMMNPPGGSFMKNSFYRLYRTIPELQKIVDESSIKIDVENELLLRYTFEILATKISIDALSNVGVKPDALLGGSLGELSLPLALGCILTDNDTGSDVKLVISEYIKIVITELSNLLYSQSIFMKKYYDHTIKDIEKWYLKCPVELVEKVVSKESRHSKVFITIIGSPNDVIITGSKDACARVKEQIKCFATRLDDAILAHTPILEKGRKKMKNTIMELKIHLRETLPYEIYSTSKLQKLDSSIEMFADNFVNCIINQVNMIDVMKYAYNDGCKVFIDLGTSRLCKQWAKETFSNEKDVLILSIFEEAKCRDSLLLFLAKLLSNGISFSRDEILRTYRFLTKDDLEFSLVDSIRTADSGKEVPGKEIPEVKSLQIDNKESGQQEILHAEPEKLQDESSKREIESRKKAEPSKKSEAEVIVRTQSLQNVTETISDLKMEKQKLYLNQIRNNQEVYKYYLDCQKSMLTSILGESVPEDLIVEDVAENTNSSVLYEYDDILEMTNGSMSKVLGADYIDVDKYDIRARMPSPPFLFITRILNINATFGKLEDGSSVEAEYDVRDDCILKVGKNAVSPLVFGEASHVGIFLAGYMGIDAMSNGTARFRVTDTETIYQEQRMPVIGETARISFVIEKFIKNGDMTLIHCRHKVYVNNIMCIESKEIGGFFTDEVLNNGTGIHEKIIEYKGEEKKNLYQPISDKKTFDKEEVSYFLQGHAEKCFGGRLYHTMDVYSVKENLFLFDRVTAISSTGGRFGMGYCIAEKEIDESFWPFQAHFKNDPILPGTIMLEGITQTSLFYQTYLGFYNYQYSVDVRFEPGNKVKTSFRGQVHKGKHTLQYRIDAREYTVESYGHRFVHDAAVFCDGVYVISQKNIALQLTYVK